MTKRIPKCTHKNYYVNYYPGKGCECNAHYDGECCCGDVDWTPIATIELREESTRLQLQTSWQSMDTAPLDGTYIDLWLTGRDRVPNCCFIDGYWHEWQPCGFHGQSLQHVESDGCVIQAWVKKPNDFKGFA